MGCRSVSPLEAQWQIIGAGYEDFVGEMGARESLEERRHFGRNNSAPANPVLIICSCRFSENGAVEENEAQLLPNFSFGAENVFNYMNSLNANQTIQCSCVGQGRQVSLFAFYTR